MSEEIVVAVQRELKVVWTGLLVVIKRNGKNQAVVDRKINRPVLKNYLSQFGHVRYFFLFDS